MKPIACMTGLYREEQGASATEYAVLILLIILVALTAITALGSQVDQAFDKFIEVFVAAESD